MLWRKAPVPRWKIGLCVAALATLCGAHWSPLDSHLHGKTKQKIKRPPPGGIQRRSQASPFLLPKYPKKVHPRIASDKGAQALLGAVQRAENFSCGKPYRPSYALVPYCTFSTEGSELLVNSLARDTVRREGERERKVAARGNRADKGRDEFREGCEEAKLLLADQR
ncbi:hypothetical protein INR49_011203 [Caranx melampygus]|nr:hypothetical protein INR49_011203 [Caranx melampygus]